MASRKKTETVDDGWIVTYTGKKFRPLEPDPSDVDLDDISHALSNICRFTGHCREFYSVAQHSVLVSRLAAAHTPNELGEPFDPDHQRIVALAGLLHDATEAYLCDVARPVKRQDGFAAYRVAETRLWVAIANRFDLPVVLPDEVKLADEKIVTNEAYALMPTVPEGWQLRTGYTTQELEYWANHPNPFVPAWTPAEAKVQFEQALRRLL